jgi:hypothetical protein
MLVTKYKKFKKITQKVLFKFLEKNIRKITANLSVNDSLKCSLYFLEKERSLISNFVSGKESIGLETRITNKNEILKFISFKHGFFQ